MSDILERLRVQARSGLMFLPHDFKVVSYGEAADEITRLHTALSEAEQRVKNARREALEEAAILAGSIGDEQIRSGSLDLEASVDKIIVAIRALIPSEPHYAEGRE